MRNRLLAKPAIVLALGVLIANDHVFKQQFPGWVTGKLSDAAGLFVLGALIAWLRPRRLAAALIAAGAGFAVWKSELSTPLIAAWNHLSVLPVGRVVDLTDLLALPFLAFGAKAVAGGPWVRRHAGREPAQSSRKARRWQSDFAVALVSLVAFTATSKLYSFKLQDHGGPRTVVYTGSPSELAAALEACGIDGFPETETGEVGVYVEARQGTGGIHLSGSLRETQGRTVLIFEEGSSRFDPAFDPTFIDRSIAAIETCLDPPEIELPAAETRDAGHLLDGREATFVVSGNGGRTLVHNPDRAEKRFPPASTFKIPNMMIALETGVATGPDFLIPWDGKRPADEFWARSWSRDHTLRSATRNGVLWYYQEIARRVGRDRMVAWVSRFNYGNRDVSGPIDRFWLDGPLGISAREQVEFLHRFLDARLGLSARTTLVARDVLVLETSERHLLAGKTGSIWLPSGRLLAWLVGYVEDDHESHVFALNLECVDFESCNLDMRRRLALAILDDWGILAPRAAARDAGEPAEATLVWRVSDSSEPLDTAGVLSRLTEIRDLVVAPGANAEWARRNQIPDPTVATLERMFAVARPISMDDPLLVNRHYVPWCRVAFTAAGRRWKAGLLFGGFGFITDDSGRTGAFLLDITDYLRAHSGEPPAQPPPK